MAQLQGQEYGAERQERIEKIKEELDRNDPDKVVSALGLLVNRAGIFTNPAKIELAGVVGKGD